MYGLLQEDLLRSPERWLVTGGAGFIGSHVVEKLLELGQDVRILDDFSSGRFDHFSTLTDTAEIMEGDIRDRKTVEKAMEGRQRVVHLAAMSSVTRSMEDPGLCHEINTAGTVNVFQAARRARVRQVSYASSSAVYGDDARDLKHEEHLGRCLSPYAASKRMNEIDAQMMHTCFGFSVVGLRLFNVFGPRQDPESAHAAVIPQWLDAMKNGREICINGDGEHTRDFCFVREVVQALLLATMTDDVRAFGGVFNVGLGQATTLLQLYALLKSLVEEQTGVRVNGVVHRDARPGDIKHSRADVTCAREVLKFSPEYPLRDALEETVASF